VDSPRPGEHDGVEVQGQHQAQGRFGARLERGHCRQDLGPLMLDPVRRPGDGEEVWLILLSSLRLDVRSKQHTKGRQAPRCRERASVPVWEFAAIPHVEERPLLPSDRPHLEHGGLRPA
jgi:hypothetical protein